MVWRLRGLRTTPRFFPFTAVGKMAADTREDVNLKYGFRSLKFQMPFRQTRGDTEQINTGV